MKVIKLFAYAGMLAVLATACIIAYKKINWQKFAAPQPPTCLEGVAFTINETKFTAPRDYIIDQTLPPEEKCVLTDLGTMDSINISGGEPFMLSTFDPSDFNEMQRVPMERVQVGGSFSIGVLQNLPLEAHPTYDKEPVKVLCFNQSKCLVRYVHPQGFWVEYQRDFIPGDYGPLDLRIRQQIDEMMRPQ